MKRITVNICSYNPNLEKLNYVLDSLKQQTISSSLWDLTIIDNASQTPIATCVDLNWHPNAKILVEPKLGLLNARNCAIEQTETELMLILDDDTSVASNYIEKALEIATAYPFVGCFGGNQLGVFKQDPDPLVLPFLELVGHRIINTKRIANLYEWNNTPAGAGAVIRTHIAKEYVKQTSKDPVRLGLGKRGESLMTSEDIDMAYTAIDMGYLNGLFPELILHHYLPESNLSFAYLIKRTYFNTISSIILNYARFKKSPHRPSFNRFALAWIKLTLKGKSFHAALLKAKRKGVLDAIDKIKQMQSIPH